MKLRPVLLVGIFSVLGISIQSLASSVLIESPRAVIPADDQLQLEKVRDKMVQWKEILEEVIHSQRFLDATVVEDSDFESRQNDLDELKLSLQKGVSELSFLLPKLNDLLSAKANPREVLEKEGGFALFSALLDKDKPSFEVLLKYGAPADYKIGQHSLLYFAKKFGDGEITDALAQRGVK